MKTLALAVLCAALATSSPARADNTPRENLARNVVIVLAAGQECPALRIDQFRLDAVFTALGVGASAFGPGGSFFPDAAGALAQVHAAILNDRPAFCRVADEMFGPQGDVLAGLLRRR